MVSNFGQIYYLLFYRNTSDYRMTFMGNRVKAAEVGPQGTQDRWNIDLQQMLGDDKYHGLIKWGNEETLDKLEEQYVRQAELMAKNALLS